MKISGKTLTGATLILLIGGIGLMLRGRGGEDAAIPTDAPARGPADPAIAIVEWGDFQCPACQQVQPLLEQLMEVYPGGMRLVFRHRPLRGHLWAFDAGRAAECARDQGAFWEYHDALYERQEEWSQGRGVNALFVSYAEELGLSGEAFGACLDGEAAGQRVMADLEEAQRLDVNSTPTFFVDGTRAVGGEQLLDVLREKVRADQ